VSRGWGLKKKIISEVSKMDEKIIVSEKKKIASGGGDSG